MLITKHSLSGNKSLLPSLIMQKILTVEWQKNYSKNYTKSFNHENYANDTELSKKYWEMKRSTFVSKVILEINSFKGKTLIYICIYI